VTTRYVDLQPVGMGAFGLVWSVMRKCAFTILTDLLSSSLRLHHMSLPYPVINLVTN
jgi:hypothetical protein